MPTFNLFLLQGFIELQQIKFQITFQALEHVCIDRCLLGLQNTTSTADH